MCVRKYLYCAYSVIRLLGGGGGDGVVVAIHSISCIPIAGTVDGPMHTVQYGVENRGWFVSD